MLKCSNKKLKLYKKNCVMKKEFGLVIQLYIINIQGHKHSPLAWLGRPTVSITLFFF